MAMYMHTRHFTADELRREASRVPFASLYFAFLLRTYPRTGWAGSLGQMLSGEQIWAFSVTSPGDRGVWMLEDGWERGRDLHRGLLSVSALCGVPSPGNPIHFLKGAEHMQRNRTLMETE